MQKRPDETKLTKLSKVTTPATFGDFAKAKWPNLRWQILGVNFKRTKNVTDARVSFSPFFLRFMYSCFSKDLLSVAFSYVDHKVAIARLF